MAWWIWALIAVEIILLIAFVISIVGAQEGYEDKTGWHKGREE